MKTENNMVLYTIVQQKLWEFNKSEITTDEFKRVIRNIRITPKIWFIIAKEMDSLSMIEYKPNRIIINGVEDEV